jgi:Family of unknown function (DUF6174)
LLEESRARDSASEATREFLRDELPRREAQWAAHALTNYRLAARVICLCTPEPPVAVIAVRGDSMTISDAVGLPYKANLSPSLPSSVRTLGLSVPALFAEVRHAVVDTTWTVEVTFDSTYGFPNEIHKLKRIGARVSDEEFRALSEMGYRLVVESFEALAREPSSPRRLRQN